MTIFIAREEPFTCEHCQAAVEPLKKGTYRNHCPVCLWSKHVDKTGPGDRESLCLGLMQPVGIDYDAKKGGWMIVHVCVRCQKKITNRTAPDDDMNKIPKSGN